MTREYLSNRIDVICSSVFGRFENKKILLDQIFDEKEALEAQLKAKDEEIERLKKLVNSMNNTYSVGDFDFESYYAMLKENNEN